MYISNFKYAYISLLLLIFSLHVTAQHCFFKYSTSSYQGVNSRITETSANNYLIGFTEIDEINNSSHSAIYKLNPEGEIISINPYDILDGSGISCIKTINLKEDIHAIAYFIDSISPEHKYRKFYIDLINEDLKLIKHYYITSCQDSIGLIKQIAVMSDSIIYLLETIHEENNMYGTTKIKKLNLNTDAINTYTTNNNFIDFSWDIMVSEKHNRLSFFYSGRIPELTKSYSKILELDLNLNFIRYIDVPQILSFYSFASKENDSTYLLTGLSSIIYQPYTSCDAISLFKMKYSHDTIQGVYYYPEYPEDTVLYPFFRNNITINNTKIGIAGIYNLNKLQYPLQSSPCWVQLTLFDHDLNMEKQLYYGNGIKAYYGMDIIATEDGGFAMTGIVYDKQNQTNPQPDLFVLKVNSEGLMTGNNEMENPAMTEVILWPNPGKEKITVKTAMQLKEATFELYNTNGKLCLTESLTAGNTNTINTAALPAGIYPYRIINAGTVVGTGKWVRE